jgi:hypothetical protein
MKVQTIEDVSRLFNLPSEKIKALLIQYPDVCELMEGENFTTSAVALLSILIPENRVTRKKLVNMLTIDNINNLIN